MTPEELARWKQRLLEDPNAELPPTTGQEVSEGPPTEGFGAVKQHLYDTARGVEAGAANKVAQLIGIGPEAWELGKRLMGSKEALAPGEAMATIRGYMEDLGIPTGRLDSVAGRYGENLVEGLLLLGMGFAGGGRMAASRFAPVRSVGEALTSRPGQATAIEATGALGQSVFEDEYGGGTGSLVGFYGGSQLGGPVSRAGKLAVDLVSAPFQKSHSAIWGRGATPPPEGIIKGPLRQGLGAQAQVDMSPMVAPASQRVRADGLQWERKIRQEYNKLATRDQRGAVSSKPLSADELNRRFETRLEGIESQARQQEGLRWEAATKGQTVETYDLKDQVEWLRDELRASQPPSSIPLKIMDDILKLPDDVPVRAELINGFASELYKTRQAIKRNPLYEGDATVLSMNFGRLEDLLRDHLAKNIPTSDLIDEARELTRMRKSLFSSGPAGESKFLKGREKVSFTSPTTGKQVELNFSQDPRSSTFLQTRGGLEQLQEIEKQYGASELVNDYSNVVKEELRQTLKSGDGPVNIKAGQEFMTEFGKRMQANAPVLREMEMTLENLTVQEKLHRDIGDSIFARITGDRGPEFAIHRMFNETATLPRDMRKLVSGFAKPQDRPALEAVRRATIGEIFQRAGHDITEVKFFLEQNPKYRHALEIAYAGDPGKLARFDRLLDVGTRILKEGDTQGLKGPFRLWAISLAGIGGATAGRLLGTGTIQVPGMFASGFRGVMQRAIGRVLPDKPGDMLYNALSNPAYERWMLSTVPDGPEGITKMMRDLKNTLTISDTAMDEAEAWYMESLGIPQGLR